MFDRQAFAALRAAAFQDCPAVFCRHPRAKTVLFRAAAVVWLKCSLRHNYAPLNFHPEVKTLSLRKKRPGVKVHCLARKPLTRPVLGNKFRRKNDLKRKVVEEGDMTFSSLLRLILAVLLLGTAAAILPANVNAQDNKDNLRKVEREDDDDDEKLG